MPQLFRGPAATDVIAELLGTAPKRRGPAAAPVSLASSKDIDVRENALPVDEESFQIGIARAMGLEPVQQQQASSENLRSLFERSAEVPVETDLSPVAGFIKGVFGKDVGYKAPQRGEDKAQMLAKIQGVVGDSEQGTMSSILGGVKQALANREVTTKARMQNQQQARGAGSGKLKPLGDAAITKISRINEAVAEAAGLEAVIDEYSEVMGTAGKYKSLLLPTVFAEKENKAVGALGAGKQVIAKLIEGGVLRDADEKKYERLLPNIGDSPEVAKSKARNFNLIVNRAASEYIKNYQRAQQYDVGGFEGLQKQYEQTTTDLTDKKQQKQVPPTKPKNPLADAAAAELARRRKKK